MERYAEAAKVQYAEYLQGVQLFPSLLQTANPTCGMSWWLVCGCRSQNGTGLCKQEAQPLAFVSISQWAVSPVFQKIQIALDLWVFWRISSKKFSLQEPDIYILILKIIFNIPRMFSFLQSPSPGWAPTVYRTWQTFGVSVPWRTVGRAVLNPLRMLRIGKGFSFETT